MAARGIATLAYAVRMNVVARRFGQLLMPLSLLAAVPLLVALAFGELRFAWHCAAVTAVMVAAGGGLARLQTPLDVRPNEAMVVTALIFILAAAAMTWPFTGDGLTWLDAWFEAVSAITTTGLTTVADIDRHSPAFLFTRAWMQWYGGLAIVVLAVALVLEPGVAARRLAGTDTEPPDVVGSTRTRARHALAVYMVLSVIAFAGLLLAGASPFDALLHGLAAVSTGGFSSHAGSLGAVGGLGAQIVGTILSFAGAISLMLYIRLWRGGWRSVAGDPGLHALIWCSLAATLLIGLFMVVVGDRSWTEALRHAPLIAVSAQTTTGFSTIDVGTLDPASKLTLIGSMFVGGDSGSTAGGIKIVRLLVVIALVRLVFIRTRLPAHAVAEPEAAGRRLEGPDLRSALAIVILYAGVIAASWLIFVAHGQAPLDALFEVVSATGTVGLSTGITGTALAPVLKLVLAADMLMGRLEIVALIVLFYPPTWFGRRTEVS